MTDTLLVTSTAEGTGKTAIAIALAQLAQRHDEVVGYMKPRGARVRTRVGKVLDADPLLAKEVLDLEESIETMEPIVYSTTFLQEVMRGGVSPGSLREAVADAHADVAADRDRVIVEGGTDPSVGASIDLTDADLAALLDARVIVVSRFDGPRGIDAVLGTARAFGDRLNGVVFNQIDHDARTQLEADAIPFLEGRDVPVLGSLPRERLLATVTIGELSEELGADVHTSCPTDGRVESFVVGAMSSDAALRHFRRARDAVVITGGDRPGIQTAAMEAPGVRGLLLTGGYRPPDRVLTRANDREIPVLSVPGDTLRTIERVEAVLGEGRTRDIAEVDAMRELLETHADVDAMLESP